MTLLARVDDQVRGPEKGLVKSAAQLEQATRVTHGGLLSYNSVTQYLNIYILSKDAALGRSRCMAFHIIPTDGR